MASSNSSVLSLMLHLDLTLLHSPLSSQVDVGQGLGRRGEREGAKFSSQGWLFIDLSAKSNHPLSCGPPTAGSLGAYWRILQRSAMGSSAPHSPDPSHLHPPSLLACPNTPHLFLQGLFVLTGSPLGGGGGGGVL